MVPESGKDEVLPRPTTRKTTGDARGEGRLGGHRESGKGIWRSDRHWVGRSDISRKGEEAGVTHSSTYSGPPMGWPALSMAGWGWGGESQAGSPPTPATTRRAGREGAADSEEPGRFRRWGAGTLRPREVLGRAGKRASLKARGSRGAGGPGRQDGHSPEPGRIPRVP